MTELNTDTERADGGIMRRGLVAVLRDRAESYWRDAVTLRADGDLPMAAVYETVSHELRLCADILASSDPECGDGTFLRKAMEHLDGR